jgi:hypothetical protein
LGRVEIFVEGLAGAELLARLPAYRMVGSEFESLLSLSAGLFKENSDEVKKEFLCIMHSQHGSHRIETIQKIPLTQKILYISTHNTSTCFGENTKTIG